MDIVWLAYTGEYSDRDMAGVFRKYEDAKKACCSENEPEWEVIDGNNFEEAKTTHTCRLGIDAVTGEIVHTHLSKYEELSFPGQKYGRTSCMHSSPKELKRQVGTFTEGLLKHGMFHVSARSYLNAEDAQERAQYMVAKLTSLEAVMDRPDPENRCTHYNAKLEIALANHVKAVKEKPSEVKEKV